MSEPADGSPSTMDPNVTQPLTPLPADAPWWARWLRDNWRAIFREVSTWLITATGVLAGLAEVLPVYAPTLSQYIGDSLLHKLTVACAIAALIAKFVKQKGLTP